MERLGVKEVDFLSEYDKQRGLTTLQTIKIVYESHLFLVYLLKTLINT